MFVDALEGPDFYGFLVNTDTFSNYLDEQIINKEIYDFPNNRKVSLKEN